MKLAIFTNEHGELIVEIIILEYNAIDHYRTFESGNSHSNVVVI